MDRQLTTGGLLNVQLLLVCINALLLLLTLDAIMCQPDLLQAFQAISIVSLPMIYQRMANVTLLIHTP